MIKPHYVEPQVPGAVAVQDRSDATAGSDLAGVFLMIQTLETGGSERQFSALAQSLDPANFRVNLGCIRQRGTFLDELGEIPQFRLGGSLYGMQSLRTRFQLARHLRQAEIAIAHAFDFYANLTLIPAARMARVPVVIGSQRQLGDLLSWAQSRVQFTMFRWCAVVICNSQAAADRPGTARASGRCHRKRPACDGVREGGTRTAPSTGTPPGVHDCAHERSV